MLFHRAGVGSWIAEGIALMRQEPHVIVTCPRAGPPQARNWLEKLTGHSFETAPKEKWRRVDFTSTRYFLMDMAKFKACLPLLQAKPGEPLENSLTHTFRQKGYEQLESDEHSITGQSIRGAMTKITCAIWTT